MLAPGVAAQVARRPEENEVESGTALMLTVPDARVGEMLAHRSHSSHSSHRSHVSGGGGHYSGYSGSTQGGGSYEAPAVPRPSPEPAPRPATPARVSFVAFPGGRIFVNGTLMGTDSTQTLTLKPGSHVVRVENRFLGEHSTTVTLSDGQTGAVTIAW